MQKRKLIIGDYDTALEGWTLSALDFPEPEPQNNFVEVPGRDGPLDLSTTLTDGEPRFGSRTLTATLECSNGIRADRTQLVSDIINRLHGRRLDIILPDAPERYTTGRISVRKEYNDLAHAAVSISAVCDPWLYNQTETRLRLTASASEQLAALSNSGRRVVTPEVTVTGGPVKLACNGKSWELAAGTYRLPTLLLRPGNTALTYSGAGTISITYREAVL